ncbi:MAG: PspC domain-containing protein [Anaerolineales bacterium]|nr:PspC domain-containing protein [Anaerolineales bacterium]MCA9927407.1 PspC domain-containing protein [Anaerolineales bacterium]
MSETKLVRSQSDRMFFGVAAGIADYVNLDPVIVRLIFVLLALSGGPGILIYIILAIVMPEEGAPAAKANVFDEEEIVIKES